MGFPEMKLGISGKVVSKACFDHGIAKSLLKRLPEVISNPKALYHPANPNRIDSVVVMTFETKQGVPIIVPIRKRQRRGRIGQYNLVASIYAKEGPNPETKWREQGLLIKSF